MRVFQPQAAIGFETVHFSGDGDLASCFNFNLFAAKGKHFLPGMD